MSRQICDGTGARLPEEQPAASQDEVVVVGPWLVSQAVPVRACASALGPVARARRRHWVIALIGVPKTAEAAGSMTGEGPGSDHRSARSALDLRSQRADLRCERAVLRCLLSDTVQQVGEVGPEATQTQSVERRAEPRAPGDARVSGAATHGVIRAGRQRVPSDRREGCGDGFRPKPQHERGRGRDGGGRPCRLELPRFRGHFTLWGNRSTRCRNFALRTHQSSGSR